MMKAVFLEKPGGHLVMKEVNIPVPGPGEVLIKMKAAPVNPSDLARIRNTAAGHDLATFIPGIEGSGTVEVKEYCPISGSEKGLPVLRNMRPAVPGLSIWLQKPETVFL